MHVVIVCFVVVCLLVFFGFAPTLTGWRMKSYHYRKGEKLKKKILFQRDVYLPCSHLTASLCGGGGGGGVEMGAPLKCAPFFLSILLTLYTVPKKQIFLQSLILLDSQE